MFCVRNAVGYCSCQFCVRSSEAIYSLLLITNIAGVKQFGKSLKDAYLHGVGILELVHKQMGITRLDVILNLRHPK